MIRITGLLLAGLIAGCAPAVASSPGVVSPAANLPDAVYRADLIEELNAARTDPAGYARKVRAFRALFRGDRIERPGETAIVTNEGTAAVDEAIAFLEAQAPLPALRGNPGLDQAAGEHATDQALSGAVAHTGADGSSPADRMRRRGRWSATGEAIAYGPDRAEDVILQLIVDDGVPDRGHRRILFNPVYGLVGSACAPHRVWRRVCVLDFARAS
ncbi:uncharacterized protein YkwD [Brevundimonas alba]|uniref:Uncharacterized protein YkwD n=1 Tax=Brevundimonas alba TaxID=74314 RepID=A0A7X6BNI3_9CAUL|nr:CAP domain-containing protein [Brevundimonas alba]NJC40760.1 uncharacterized protein YkwD [Brevundimonas alba]